MSNGDYGMNMGMDQGGDPGFSDPNFGDVIGGSSSSDLPGTDVMGAPSWTQPLSNFGSNLGGLMPSTLGGGGQGAGVSVGGGRARKTSRGHYLMGGAVYRHRMNPANPRALRRAISRISSFEKMAKRVLRITSPHHHVAGFKKHRRRR